PLDGQADEVVPRLAGSGREVHDPAALARGDPAERDPDHEASTPSSATTRFEPPPSTRTRSRRWRAQPRASSTAVSSRASMKYRAGPPTPSVVSGAKGTFPATITVAPATP